jgi:hypothetical protein
MSGLFNSLEFVADLQCGTLLWGRDLTKTNYGHIDFQRMQEANVALGSEYDDSVTVPFDITDSPLIVEALLNEGFSKGEIRTIMEENVKRLLLEIL